MVSFRRTQVKQVKANSTAIPLVNRSKAKKSTIKTATNKSKAATSAQVNLQYIDMIREAIENLKSITTYAKRGISQQKIKKVNSFGFIFIYIYMHSKSD